MTRSKIRKELDRLARMVEKAWKRWESNPGFVRGDGPMTCPGVGSPGRCTNTAVWLADRLGGQVYGYSAEDNHNAEIGAAEGGHDFAVVDGRWLADFWAKDSYQLPDLYDMNSPREMASVVKRYGDPSRWTRMTQEQFAWWRKDIST